MNLKVISGAQFPREVIPLINSAKSSLNLVVFDWRWYANDPGASCQLFNQSIIRAVRRGVQVRIIASSLDIVNIFNKLGAKAKKIQTKRLLHCKLLTIDDKIVVTGSHNYTKSAFQYNLELSVIISNHPEIASFVQFFNNLWSK